MSKDKSIDFKIDFYILEISNIKNFTQLFSHLKSYFFVGKNPHAKFHNQNPLEVILRSFKVIPLWPIVVNATIIRVGQKESNAKKIFLWVDVINIYI